MPLRHDGREIVYLAPDGMLMAVSVATAGSAVSLGKPSPLFKVTADAGGWGSSWAVTRDHTRFVVVEAPRAAKQHFRLLSAVQHARARHELSRWNRAVCIW